MTTGQKLESFILNCVSGLLCLAIDVPPKAGANCSCITNSPAQVQCVLQYIITAFCSLTVLSKPEDIPLPRVQELSLGFIGERKRSAF